MRKTCIKTALGMGLLLLPGSVLAQTNLITNGSFETGTFSPVIAGSWVNVASGAGNIPGWSVGCVSPTTSCIIN